jgi:DNA-binding CsgD family transcriptional regulator
MQKAYISKLITESGHRKLSKQETKVFKLLLEEHKSAEIAKMMGLDEKTVSTYKLRILQKTNSKTIIGLYLFNEKHKLVSLNKTA